MMLRPVALLAILLAAFIPGAFALGLWRRRLAHDPVEFGFAGLSLGLLLIGWLALVLAEFGLFSLVALAATWLIATGALAAAWLWQRRRTRPSRGPAPDWSRWEIAALVAWAIAASVLYFRPHESILGGADAGVYVNLGANIATTGSILIHDPLLGQLDPQLRSALLRAMPPREAAPYYLLPGFYVTGDPADLVTPQFFHLHPAWQAVGYALGGLRTELWITPLWGLLGCLAVYMTVRTLWGWRPALLVLIALCVTALQVWFARYPTAEVLTQYLFWTGTWALIQWLDRRDPPALWAMLAGVAFGEVFLARIDTYVLLALPVILAGWFTLTRSWCRDAAWFFVPLLALALHSVLHGWFVTRPYFTLITRVGTNTLLRTAVPAIVAFGLLAAVVALWVRLRPNWRAGTEEKAASILRVAAVAVILLALYAYFVRPVISETRLSNYWYGGGQLPALDQQNFVRLGWYLSPLGLALAVGGIALMYVREFNRRTAFLLIAASFFTLVFLWRIGANPHQVYAMRRYVPVVLPFLTIGAVYLLSWLWGRFGTRGRISAGVLTLAWILGIFASGQPFLTQVDDLGLSDQIAGLSRSLADKSVLLFGDTAPVGVGDFVGTPLRFLEGKPVFVARDASGLDAGLLREAVRQWHAQGYRVYWIATDGAAPWPAGGPELGPAEQRTITVASLEGSYDYKPAKVLESAWRLTIAEVLPGAQP